MTNPSRSDHFPDTGMLMHGRHLAAIGWEDMMWGHPESNALGTGPRAILSMLDEDPYRIKLLTIGAAGSRSANGLTEAEVEQAFLLDGLKGGIEDFRQIREHPRWIDGKTVVQRLIENAILDLMSVNTNQELIAASRLFTENGIRRAIQVTGMSHGPRALRDQSALKNEGIIPLDQAWQLVIDDIPYPGTHASDTLVVEQPHRGDEPSIVQNWDFLPADVFRRFFAIPVERQAQFLSDVSALVDKAIDLPQNLNTDKSNGPLSETDSSSKPYRIYEPRGRV